LLTCCPRWCAWWRTRCGCSHWLRPYWHPAAVCRWQLPAAAVAVASPWAKSPKLCVVPSPPWRSLSTCWTVLSTLAWTRMRCAALRRPVRSRCPRLRGACVVVRTYLLRCLPRMTPGSVLLCLGCARARRPCSRRVVICNGSSRGSVCFRQRAGCPCRRRSALPARSARPHGVRHLERLPPGGMGRRTVPLSLRAAMLGPTLGVLGPLVACVSVTVLV
jgi:hypothetical protein